MKDEEERPRRYLHSRILDVASLLLTLLSATQGKDFYERQAFSVDFRDILRLPFNRVARYRLTREGDYFRACTVPDKDTRK